MTVSPTARSLSNSRRCGSKSSRPVYAAATSRSRSRCRCPQLRRAAAAAAAVLGVAGSVRAGRRISFGGGAALLCSFSQNPAFAAVANQSARAARRPQTRRCPGTRRSSPSTRRVRPSTLLLYLLPSCLPFSCCPLLCPSSLLLFLARRLRVPFSLLASLLSLLPLPSLSYDRQQPCSLSPPSLLCPIPSTCSLLSLAPPPACHCLLLVACCRPLPLFLCSLPPPPPAAMCRLHGSVLQSCYGENRFQQTVGASQCGNGVRSVQDWCIRRRWASWRCRRPSRSVQNTTLMAMVIPVNLCVRACPSRGRSLRGVGFPGNISRTNQRSFACLLARILEGQCRLAGLSTPCLALCPAVLAGRQGPEDAGEEGGPEGEGACSFGTGTGQPGVVHLEEDSPRVLANRRVVWGGCQGVVGLWGCRGGKCHTTSWSTLSMGG